MQDNVDLFSTSMYISELSVDDLEDTMFPFTNLRKSNELKAS